MSASSVAPPAPQTAGGSAVRPGTATSMGTGWRVLAQAGRREAIWLARNPVTLAGLIVAAWLIWLNNRVLQPQPYIPSQLPFWWSADVSIAACMLPAAGAVLIAAQLAAGRARRDSMERLYTSYPAPPALRIGAHLAAVVGPVALAAALSAAGVAFVSSHGTLGEPRLWVLGAGLVLIVLAGAAGVALGSWVRHPLAGILAVTVLGLIEIDLVLSFSDPVHLRSAIVWLFPWSYSGAVLSMLPGSGIPFPPPAHLGELAGLIALAVAVALWRALPRRRAVAAVAVAALALTGLSVIAQSRSLSGSLPVLVRQAVQPAGAEQCRTLHEVRYCYYPAFAALASQWAVPVDGVLDRVPPPARRGLTVRQVNDNAFLIPPLQPPQSINGMDGQTTPLQTRLWSFDNGLQDNPGLIPGSSTPPVYTDLGWGTGSSLGGSQLTLAMSAAQWVTGLPTTGRWISYSGGTDLVSCVPAGQAREAIALWLAAGATRQTRSAWAQRPFSGLPDTEVGRNWIATDQLAGPGELPGLTATAQGVALAGEMLRLPDRRVKAVIEAHWTTWLRPQATLAQLAAALGIGLPPAPVARPAPVAYSTSPDGAMTDEQFNPPSPLCG